MTDEELKLFNYAVGVLAGLGHKYGAQDVTICDGGIRIRIWNEADPPTMEAAERQGVANDDNDGVAR